MRNSFLSTVSRMRLHVVAACVPAILAVACTTMQPVKPYELEGADGPKSVVVKRKDGTTLIMAQPAMHGDTITGLANGASLDIPLSQVASLQARELSPDRTRNVVLVAVGAVVAGGIFYLNSRPAVGNAAHACYDENGNVINCCLAQGQNSGTGC